MSQKGGGGVSSCPIFARRKQWGQQSVGLPPIVGVLGKYFSIVL